MSSPFLLAKGSADILFNPAMANRHGLIAGATGTGKTVTLQSLAERFSSLGVPVFMADVKGDLSGLSKLKFVSVLDTPITSAGVKQLQAAVPAVRIRWRERKRAGKNTNSTDDSPR